MIRSRNNALADGLHKTQKKKRERAVYRNLKTWDTYLDVLVEVKPRLICLKYIEGTDIGTWLARWTLMAHEHAYIMMHVECEF